mmetsp:Transcript_42404/g.66402  ORF Transcript_42404/g.66402 Transcript_42404/m.66402 type:complete len:81 (-) Transcript_42404:200-442(-)
MLWSLSDFCLRLVKKPTFDESFPGLLGSSKPWSCIYFASSKHAVRRISQEASLESIDARLREQFFGLGQLPGRVCVILRT